MIKNASSSLPAVAESRSDKSSVEAKSAPTGKMSEDKMVKVTLL